MKKFYYDRLIKESLQGQPITDLYCLKCKGGKEPDQNYLEDAPLYKTCDMSVATETLMVQGKEIKPPIIYNTIKDGLQVDR